MDLFESLRSLELPLGHFAVFGSGPLIARGVIDATNDLDIISRGPAWERACVVGEVEFIEEYGVDIVGCFDHAITIGKSWAYGDFDIDNLIDTAEVIDGLPFVQLEHVTSYKQIAGRSKDLEHLRKLGSFSTITSSRRTRLGVCFRNVSAISSIAPSPGGCGRFVQRPNRHQHRVVRNVLRSWGCCPP